MRGAPLLLPLVALVLLSLSHNPGHARQLIRSFGNCPELNNYFVNRVVPLVGPYGLTSSNAYTNTRSPDRQPKDPGTPGGPAGLPLRRPFRTPQIKAFGNLTTNAAAEAEEMDSLEGVDFSGTNVQVKGVDEPDIVKTDGKRMFTISGNVFSVIEVLEGGRRGRRTGKLQLPTYPREMLFEGDYVMVIGTDSNYRRPVYKRYTTDPSYGESSTVVYQIRIIQNRPHLISTLRLEGGYVRSRETNGVARLVMRFSPLSSIWLYYPTGKVTPAQTQKWNREIVQYSRAGNWLPTYKLVRGKRVQYGVYATCGDVYYSPDVFAGFTMLTVVTLPLQGNMVPRSSASILSESQTVYSTQNSMYVTTSEFRFSDVSASSARWGANYETRIHKFALSDAGATYVASGRITGSVINQFAMHETRGVFFIATTDGATWWSNRDLSASKITSFETDTKTRTLRKIGQVGNLGVGERIFAVRYRAETAYVVTFREIDPLYIIDLAQPRNLRVLGELKIPGYSSYLHQVGPGRILGVGQEATLSGRPTGAKVSLFDVSDKTNPKELSAWSLKGSYTNAEWDHRAFLYWWRERIAVMPVSIYSGSQSFSGAIVLDVSENKITERGRVVHRTGRSWTPSILRNAIIGRKYLWSMSSEIVQVNNVQELKKVQSQVKIST